MPSTNSASLSPSQAVQVCSSYLDVQNNTYRPAITIDETFYRLHERAILRQIPAGFRFDEGDGVTVAWFHYQSDSIEIMATAAKIRDAIKHSELQPHATVQHNVRIGELYYSEALLIPDQIAINHPESLRRAGHEHKSSTRAPCKSATYYFHPVPGWAQEVADQINADIITIPPDEQGATITHESLAKALDREFSGTLAKTACDECHGTGFYTGLIVAERDDLPSWRPGDEFEAARKAALAALK